MGRKKLEVGTTVKDRVFKLLDECGSNASYDSLSQAIVDLKENTFKTILSQYRKEKGIVVKRGRRKKVRVHHETEK